MIAGIKCLGSDGKIFFNSTMYTTKILGSFFTGTENGEREIQVEEGYRLWAAMCSIDMKNAPMNNGKACFNFPIVTCSENLIKWQFSSSNISSLYTYMGLSITRVSTEVIYGVF